MVKKLEERIREQINLIIAQEIEKAVKQIYETREEQDLAVDNAKLRERVRFLEMSLEEKDENCYSLAKENRELKERVDMLEEEVEMWKINRKKERDNLRNLIKLKDKELQNYKEENKNLKDDLETVAGAYYDR